MGSGEVHNYYEQLVFSKINQLIELYGISLTDDELSDVACIALNQLPARYVRFSIDTTFYMSPQEQMKVYLMVDDAVDSAVAFVKKNTTI